MAKWKAQAAENLAIAKRYLGVKLVTTALLEALALSSGGDAPYSLFMGSVTDPPDRRLESLLPKIDRVFDADGDKVALLLKAGRSAASSFDLNNSPVSAWIYGQTRAEDLDMQLDRAKNMFAGESSPADFLKGWNGRLVGSLADVLARQVPTRSMALGEWAT